MKRDSKGEGTDHSTQLIFISYCEPVFSLLGLNRKIFQQRDIPAKPSATQLSQQGVPWDSDI